MSKIVVVGALALLISSCAQTTSPSHVATPATPPATYTARPSAPIPSPEHRTPTPLSTPTPAPLGPMLLSALFISTPTGVLRMELGCTSATDQCIHETTNISPTPNEYGYIDVSPDGALVAIARVDPYVSGLQSSIRLIDWQAGRSWMVAPEGSNFPSWSPDQATIAYVDYYRDRLCLAAIDGPFRCLPQQGLHGIGPPAWSPDGQRLAYDAEGGIHLVELAEGSDNLITADGRDPSWSPTGDYIAFTQPSPAGTTLNILALASCNASQPPCHAPITVATNATDPQWSPDGSYLAFRSYTDFDTWQLTVLPLSCALEPDSCAHTPATVGPALSPEDTFTWSPDGLYLAFTSVGSNAVSIYLVGLGSQTSWLANTIEDRFIPQLQWVPSSTQ